MEWELGSFFPVPGESTSEGRNQQISAAWPLEADKIVVLKIELYFSLYLIDGLELLVRLLPFFRLLSKKHRPKKLMFHKKNPQQKCFWVHWSQIKGLYSRPDWELFFCNLLPPIYVKKSGWPGRFIRTKWYKLMDKIRSYQGASMFLSLVEELLKPLGKLLLNIIDFSLVIPVQLFFLQVQRITLQNELFQSIEYILLDYSQITR